MSTNYSIEHNWFQWLGCWFFLLWNALPSADLKMFHKRRLLHRTRFIDLISFHKTIFSLELNSNYCWWFFCFRNSLLIQKAFNYRLSFRTGFLAKLKFAQALFIFLRTIISFVFGTLYKRWLSLWPDFLTKLKFA